MRDDPDRQREAPSTVYVGMRVQKAKGFKFPGVVRCVFTTAAGAVRCVVEADHADFAGMLHIYDPNQLETRP